MSQIYTDHPWPLVVMSYGFKKVVKIKMHLIFAFYLDYYLQHHKCSPSLHFHCISLQLSPSHTSHHLCRMVQSILLASSETPNPTSSQPGESFDSLPGSQGSLPSSQGSLPSSQSQTSRSFLSGLSGLTLSPTLRAHAYITLGKIKICIRCNLSSFLFRRNFFALM